jgi:hypothetical protein
MRCFLHKEVGCDETCMAFNEVIPTMCLLLGYLVNQSKKVQLANVSFPPSPPPPEVR